jgi:hypothetical protein
MKTRKPVHRPTRGEVDELVIREALSDNAWDPPIDVAAQPSAKRVAVRRLDLAAKFQVLSVLFQLGADAAFSVVPDKDVDITLVRNPGEVVTIDVKLASKDQLWKATDFPPLEHHFVVFVSFPAQYPLESPFTYIATSREVRDWAQAHDGSISVANLARVAKTSRNAWNRLLPAA